MSPVVKFKQLSANAILPQYQSEGAAGMDLHWSGKIGPRGTLAESDGFVTCEPMLFGTGIAIEIPPGFEGQIRPRSSSGRDGIHCHFGTIDSDYRGELFVRLQLLSGDPDDSHRIWVGDRIAQLVIAPVSRARIEVVAELSMTKRGEGGFGSTGK